MSRQNHLEDEFDRLLYGYISKDISEFYLVFKAKELHEAGLASAAPIAMLHDGYDI